MKVKVTARIPEFGKGWYKLTYPRLEQMDDSDILTLVRREYRDNTGIRIEREYPSKEVAA